MGSKIKCTTTDRPPGDRSRRRLTDKALDPGQPENCKTSGRAAVRRRSRRNLAAAAAAKTNRIPLSNLGYGWPDTFRSTISRTRVGMFVISLT